MRRGRAPERPALHRRQHAAPATAPAPATTTDDGEDISGPCDEAEHANDPRCTGARGDDRDDDRGRDDDRRGDDDDSGHGSDDHDDDDNDDDDDDDDRSGSNSGRG